jgi:hypothetical protein
MTGAFDMAIKLEEVTSIAQAIFTASDDAQTGRTTYLRTLLIATQEELGTKKGQEATVQAAALSLIHEKFYALVLKAAEPFVPKGTKDRAIELHARANFARTALSALRGHIRAGGDLVTLSAAKTTKASLKVREGPTRPPSARRLKAKAEVQSKAVVATLMGLADTDKAAAVEEIQLLLGQLTTQLVALGVVSTTDSAAAIAEHRPLRIGRMLFVPTASQVIQQRSKPS